MVTLADGVCCVLTLWNNILKKKIISPSDFIIQNGDILTGFSLVKIISILIVLFPSIMFLDVELTNKKIFGLIFAFTAIYLLA